MQKLDVFKMNTYHLIHTEEYVKKKKITFPCFALEPCNRGQIGPRSVCLGRNIYSWVIFPDFSVPCSPEQHQPPDPFPGEINKHSDKSKQTHYNSVLSLRLFQIPIENKVKKMDFSSPSGYIVVQHILYYLKVEVSSLKAAVWK